VVASLLQSAPFWKPLRYHEVQQQFFRSDSRFNVVPAGRRSGKTDIAIRRVGLKSLAETIPNAWYILGGPTEGQARRIFWQPLQDLFPPSLVAKVSVGAMTVRLINSVEITVMGMDAPQRAEGRPIRHLLLDEYGNMHAHAWTAHLRPALSDQEGTADFIGVPEGRNHYYDLYLSATEDETDEWSAFTWTSEEILPAKEIEAAKRDMDPQTYDQEYRAKFINFAGRVYYNFERSSHCMKGLRDHYNPDAPLILGFDFNASPGVAVVVQEINGCTCVIGEVYIERNSNTEIVALRIAEQWGSHQGEVRVYGDASGGARTSSAVRGSDWDLVRGALKPVFGSRLVWRVPRANPAERARINSVNSRLKSVDGTIRFWIDPIAAPMTVRDLEGVRYKGQKIHKPTNPNDPESKLTHISDALGYYIQRAHPLSGGGTLTSSAA